MNDGLDVHQFSRSSENIDEVINNSLNSGEGVVSKTKTVSKRSINKRMRKMIAAASLVTSVGLGMELKTGLDNFNDFLTLRYSENEFWKTYIDPNVHKNGSGPIIDGEPLIGNGTFSYYYGNIADAISADGEIKDDVYYMTKTMNKEEDGKYVYIDAVLAHTEYGNFETFLSENGYESEEEFDSDVRRQILAGNFEAEKQSVSR